jgi:hypothetical protein
MWQLDSLQQAVERDAVHNRLQGVVQKCCYLRVKLILVHNRLQDVVQSMIGDGMTMVRECDKNQIPWSKLSKVVQVPPVHIMSVRSASEASGAEGKGSGALLRAQHCYR